jgi:hypothetical protein
MRAVPTRRSVNLVLGVLLVVGGALVAPGATYAADPVRIMVVGDSISQGSSGDFTWRYRLYRHLITSSAPVDFVGTRDDLYDRASATFGSHLYVDPNFDAEHAAKWGELLAFASARIEDDVRSTSAQVLLVHLGINDLALGGTVAATESALRAFVANARTANPNIKMLLGEVLLTQFAQQNADLAQRIAAYNAVLGSVTAELSTPASPLYVLPAPATYDPTLDTYDGTHPNPRGEFKLAAAYSDGLSQRFGLGGPFGPIPDVPLLGSPASLTAAPGDTLAVLTWTPVIGANGYYVWQRDITLGEDWHQLPQLVSTAAWTATQLANGHDWAFRVEAVRGSDHSGFSAVAQVRPIGTPPTAPTDLTAVSRDSGASLTWTPVPRAEQYVVYMRDVTTSEPFGRLPFLVSGPQWTAGLLVNGHPYEFKLTAVNAYGESGFSHTVSVTPHRAQPDAPQNLNAVAGDGEATLSWSPSAGADGYVVFQRDVTAGGVFARVPVSVAGTTWTGGLLINGHTYEFKVRAAVSGGESVDSPVVQATPLGPAPTAPTILSAVPRDGKAQLCWSASASAVGYVVYQRDASAGQAFIRLPTTVAGPCWTSGPLVGAHSYQFRVTAVSGNGESGFSNTASVVATGPN